MPRISHEKIENAFSVLKKEKVFDFSYLLSLLNCSVRTGRFYLKKWKAYSSYNQNGRYYTVPGVPRFDGNGLWRYRDIFFSDHGTLKSTVIHLINAASGGLTGNQIGEIVGISPRSFLHHFRDISGIRREKREGVYIYFSDDVERYEQQAVNRLEAPEFDGPMSDADVVLILVALIKHHEITAHDLAQLPEVRAKKITPQAIDEYLKQHGLEKKAPSSNR